MRRAPLPRWLARSWGWAWVAAVGPAAPSGAACPEGLGPVLAEAAARDDRSALRALTEACPDRVYLAVLRDVDRALAASGPPALTERMRTARLVAALHGEVVGHPGLGDLLARYAAWGEEARARHAEAESLRTEGNRLYARARHSEAIRAHGAALAISEALDDPRSRGLAHANLAGLHAAVSSADSARHHAERAISLGREIGFAAGTASGLFARGAIEMQGGEIRAAIGTFREIHRIGLDLGEDNYVAAALGMLANAYYLVGRYADARAMHADGLEVFRRLGQERNVIGELINLALIDATDLARARDAETELHEAIDRSRQAGFPALEGIALDALAGLENARGEPERALATAARAIELLRGLDQPENLANARTTRGRILREQGRAEEARAALAEARAIAGDRITVHSRCETLTQAAFAEIAAGDPLRGLALAEEAIDRLEAARSQLGGAALRATFLDLRTHVYEAAIHAHAESARRGEEPVALAAVRSLRLAERARSEATGAPPDTERALVRTLVDELSALQLARLETAPGSAEAIDLGRRIRRARARVDSVEESAAGGDPASDSSSRAGPRADLHPLAPDERALVFFWGRETVFRWTIESARVRFDTLGHAEDLESLVRVYGATLRDPSRDPLASALGGRLARTLLGADGEAIGPGGPAVVVLDGPLLRLPLEALPHPASSPPTPVAATHEISYVSSLARRAELAARHAARAAARIADPRRGLDLFAVADPVRPRDGALAAERWPRLPQAADELRRVHRALAPRRERRLTGHDATESVVRSADACAARILHVASHGHASAVDAGASGLLLAPDATGDGFLTPREIRTLELEADLVVLSACETGAGRIVGGQGVLGLTRAFFDAGASGVVASLWRVDDSATAALMERFYRHLAEDTAPAVALARAKRDAIGGDEGMSPAIVDWAAFVFFGSGGKPLGLSSRVGDRAAPPWVLPAGGLAVALALAVGRVLRGRSRRAARRVA